LVLPFFAILMFGIIDLGRLVFAANSLNNGAREGARFAAVGVRPAECASQSREQCAQTIAVTRSWGVDRSLVTVTAKCFRVVATDPLPVEVSMVDCRSNDLINVHTQAPFSLITPLIAQFVGPFNLQGEAEVVVNQ
jgi:hypothetical protein